ncbi:integrase core domain-containing protein [Streptomyces sp. NPDC002659]|uniref:integrase core domain-containing protein n=1 Tax=Streptomyces sp. NPDC002659 TaxID=3364656 RepID=UPI00369DB766
MESTIGLFKTELIKPQQPWKTLAEVESATAEWIDWYNHRRLHSETGNVPPAENEAHHHLTATKHQATVTPYSLDQTRNGSGRGATTRDTCRSGHPCQSAGGVEASVMRLGPPDGSRRACG